MYFSTTSVVVLLVLVCSTSFCVSAPTDTTTAENRKFHGSSSFQSTGGAVVSSYSNGYQVSLSRQQDEDGNCSQLLVIKGHGISKRVKSPCEQQQPVPDVITLGQSLLVDGYFSDTPGVLVHVTNDTCVKEVFQKKGWEYTSETEPMDEKDCDKVKVKIEVLREEQVKWEEWSKKQQQLAQLQLQQLQQDIFNLQQSIFGNLFNYFPFAQ